MPPPLVIMYHYVRPDQETIPAGIRPMLTTQFESQLDWLQHHYDILPAEEFITRIAQPRNDQKPPCLLTFDDGTADHATVVTPILTRRNLSAVFFILSGPPQQNLMPLTHALHWLLGQPDEQTWQLFQHYANHELKDPIALGDPEEAKKIYHYESPLRARIKYAANMALPREAVHEILHRAAEQTKTSLTQLAKQWFASEEQLRQMHQAGMNLAVHGHSHTSLQSLTPQAIQKEIAHCSTYLTQLTNQQPHWWACPFGASGANQQTLDAMQQAMRAHNLTRSVTTRKSPVPIPPDLLDLPRYDCIDLPPRGSAPKDLQLS